MFEILLLIGVVALGVIAYHLHGIRQRLDEDARMSESVRQEQELDAEIRDACPNLFYQFRTELREWFRIHRRQRQYYEKHKKYADVVDPHSDDEASWFDIFARLLKEASDEQKAILGEIASATDTFLKEARAKTVLKAAEMNFLAFSAWHDSLNDPRDVGALRIVRDLLKQRLESHVEVYRRVTNTTAG